MALVLQEEQDQNRILNRIGYRSYTRVEDLRAYLELLGTVEEVRLEDIIKVTTFVARQPLQGS